MRVGVAGVGRIGVHHAETLRSLAAVESIVVADVDAGRAAATAERLGAEVLADPAALFAAGLDALVIAAATDAHADLLIAAVQAGIPVFCEKPVAPDVDATIRAVKEISAHDVPVQIGFQRRFDSGYTAAKAAIAGGRLGWLHTVRATTLDPAPPPAAYVASSGGIFRDCGVHDFDIIRWVTGREVEQVYVVGGNQGESFFLDAGDVDTAACLLRIEGGTLAVVSLTRYNGAGYDVRLEALGSAGSISVGLDDGLPMRSAEAGVAFPAGPAYPGFLERFRDAYTAELAAFVDVAAGRAESACTVQDALEAFYIAEACALSLARGRPVLLAEVRR